MRNSGIEKFFNTHTGFVRGVISGNKPENKVKLSSILEHGEHLKKYGLSSKACTGILRRAENRGKVVPEKLKSALEYCVIHNTRDCNYSIPDQPNDVCSTLSASGAGVDRVGGQGAELGFFVLSDRKEEPETFCIHEAIARDTTGRTNGDGFTQDDKSFTLVTVRNQHAVAYNEPVYCINESLVRSGEKAGQQGDGYSDKDVSYTLTTMSTTHGVAYTEALEEPQAFCTSGYGASVDEVASTMMASYDKMSNQIYGVIDGSLRGKPVVRRLTPVECERLQGFPADWTKIPFNGKMPEKCSDAPRYKACGNSFAVPVIRFIGERIQELEN